MVSWADGHNVLVHNHVGQTTVPVVGVIDVVRDNGVALQRIEPEVARNPTVVPVDAPGRLWQET